MHPRKLILAIVWAITSTAALEWTYFSTLFVVN